MIRKLVHFSIVVLFGLCVVACQSRVPPPQSPEAAPVGFMQERARTTAPFPFLVFCQKNRGQCDAQGGADRVATNFDLQKVRAINASVNRAIVPQDDPPGEDIWTLSPKAGDCEDYAVTKRKELIDSGIPGRSLRLAVGTTADGEPHAVLVVRTQQGDMVLDNRNDDIRLYSDTDISWLKIESSTDPKVWYEL